MLYNFLNANSLGFYCKEDNNINYVVNFIRSLCKQIDYKMYSKERGHRTVINGERYCKKYFVYFIEKN